MLFLYAPALVRIIRTSSVTTARFLSFCVLVLSLTPMASLYIFYSLLKSEHADSNNIDSSASSSSSSSSSPSSLASVLQRSNATLGEIWMALLQERIGSNNQHEASDIYTYHGGDVGEAARQELMPSLFAVLVPWALSVFLGILCPAIGFVYAMCTRRGGWFAASSKRRRKQRLKLALQDYRKILSKEDMVLDNKQHGGDDQNNKFLDDDEDIMKWTIPLAGIPLCQQQEESQLRQVMGMCAICLTPYACKETLAWSSNPDCIHCFHEKCVVSWLLKRRNIGTQPCPCCRQSFVVR
jgi:hypothetical protein